MIDVDVDALKMELAAAQREIESLQLRLANVTLLLKKEMLLTMTEHASNDNIRSLIAAANECPKSVEELEKKSLKQQAARDRLN